MNLIIDHISTKLLLEHVKIGTATLRHNASADFVNKKGRAN